MNCVIQMIDASTGEIIYTRDVNYAFNVDSACKYDAGRKLLDDVVCSALRGTRIKNTPLSVNLTFNNSRDRLNSMDLPFQPECDEVIQSF